MSSNIKKTRLRRTLMGAFVLFALLSSSLNAQAKATVRGRVIDASTGEPVFGVAVIIRGANAFGQTDFDGKFSLQVPAGKHTIVFQMVGFDKISKTISVSGGDRNVGTITLGVKTVKGITIKGRALNNTEASVLSLQRKSGAVSDGVSAESIKKSPDSSAGDVLKRVTGISLIGGKYVFVRGLGERYSSLQLNDALLPSPDAQRKVVPMDIFPAGLIKNIRVIKTFLPENPGEFSGGLIKIETKEYPDRFTMSLGVGLGKNMATTGKDFKTNKSRGGNEYLGMDSGRRDIPGIASSLPDQIAFVRGNRFGGLPARLVNYGASQFNNDWSAKTKSAPYDRNFKFSIGDTIKFGRARFGYMLGSAYKRQWRRKDQLDVRYESKNTINNSSEKTAYLSPLQVQFSTKYNEEVLFGNNANLAFEPVPGQQLYSKTLLSWQSDNYIREGQGIVEQNQTAFQSQTNGFENRQLFVQTFGGKHALNIGSGRPHKLEWYYNASKASRKDPDLKQQVYSANYATGSAFSRLGFSPDGSRFFSEAEDSIDAVSLKYELPFKQWSGLHSKLKFGALASDRTKDFRSNTYQYRRASPGAFEEAYPAPGELTFNPARVQNGDLLFEERTQDNNYFDASQKLHAYFAQVDMPLFPKFRFIGGARYEDSYQRVLTYNPIRRGAPQYDYNKEGLGEIHTKDLLPSANFVWEVKKKMNLRLAYTETLTRPDLRELSDFGFSEYFGADLVFGNRFLRRSYIHNYDFRWEWYMKALDYVGAGVFYKRISDPIELVGQPVAGSSDLVFTYINADTAFIQGTEFDLRKDIGNFRLDVNLFFIRSSVKVMSWTQRELIRNGLVDVNSKEATLSPTSLERRLQGQSDFVYNVKLRYYLSDKKKTSFGVFYNVFGDRIAVVGAQGAPDTIEKSTGLIDLVFEHQFKKNMSLKVAAKNITNAKFKTTIRNELPGVDSIYSEYRTGINYSASFSYKF